MNDPATLDPIIAAFQAENPKTAEHLCRARLEELPDDADVLLLLGLALQQQGRPDDAVPMYRRLTELHPDDGMHWCNYATALRVAGDSVAAEQAAGTAVRLTPDDPDRLEQLGLLQLQHRKFSEARATLLRAWAKAPDSISARIYAARACDACRDLRTAELLQPWRDWLPLSDDLQLELADLLARIGEVHDAIGVLEDLLQRSPHDVPAQLLLAKSLERVNLLGKAGAMLRRIIASGAASNNSVRRAVERLDAQLAMRKRAYGVARAQLEQLGEDDDHEYGHYFALAEACDKLGDSVAAIAALATAHQRQVEEIRTYSAHLLAPDAPPLPHTGDRLDSADYRDWPQLESPDASQSPVFVVGFPRSGTTLLEQMLDAHPQLQSMDERPFFNMLASQLDDVEIQVPRDLGRLVQRDCDELRKGYLLLACGKLARDWGTRLIDKNPLNMLWLPMIHRMFPHAKFILVLRHPCDVILSCYLQNFRAAPLAVAGRSPENLACAYVAAMENWLYHVTLIHPDVFVSRYEDLVADTLGQTLRIAEFLGLDDAESMLHFDTCAREKGYIGTPSYTQVIEPINAGSIGRWRRYRECFEPLLPILEPMLVHWGYDAQTDDF
ncbi:MAG: tetratricopeptide repeat-containing sulfotransferase family protein [Rhodanobacteraceae bacterium]